MVRDGYEFMVAGAAISILTGLIYSAVDGVITAIRLEKEYFALHPEKAPVPIRMGMTSDQLRNTLGQPKQINTTVVGGLVHEQWVYGNKYFYFENGILTAVQY